jgi:hypothetical protein
MPCSHYEVGRLRTGFESVIAHRTSSLFSTVADQDGEVVEIDTNLKLCKIKYKDNSFQVIDYSTKYTDSAGTIITQKVNLNNLLTKVGAKFKKDTVLAYNPDYFEQDAYNPTQVNWKLGIYGNVALMETDGTYEDACVISEELSRKLSIIPVHRKVISLTPNTYIYKYSTIGTHIKSIDPIMTFEEIDLEMEEIKVSEAELELWEKLDRKLPKANHTGTIVNMEVYYNVHPNEMHHTLRDLVINVIRNQDLKFKKAQGTNSATDFIPSMKLPITSKFKGASFISPTVAIVYYIQDEHVAGIGDKIIFDSSLKSVISNVMSEPMTTESGRVVDAQFASQGVFNRIITSPFVQGCAQTIMEKLEDDVIKMYFNS